MSVGRLGYVGFQASNPEAWSAFATGVLGLMPSEPAAPGPRFRTDSQAWRIAIAEGPADDIDYLGFEVAGAEELAAFQRAAEGRGLAVLAGDHALAEARGVSGLARTTDPDGTGIEVYFGPTERHEIPFASPAGISGFVTGEQGIGHVVLMTPDIAASRRFYQEGLGLRLSDTIRMRMGPGAPVELEFFHCNKRHHTLALVPVKAAKRLNHFMLQVNTLDEVGFALERAQAAGAPITATLGRHTNDHMVSFYARTPSGFEVEFGFGACEVGEASWRVARHDKPSTWGHKRSPAS